ncbi:VENN motif pre-toxin domain-containing protein [Rodentibacter genomosp. 2]|uniref:Uncharacterized protein n=1 Tax=Rodentibacter genomosp. 2 TaxID=1908266 RepID=A0A1V3JDE5_9PAST|nr:VENN motif pre-toxin domain-containing protein [Rodentibacter genomosp. 2]OOF54594.1 hypothetical protein BKK55_08915 [Rodentibacter genomosp. 2]
MKAQLQEQQQIAAAVGNVKSAVETYSSNRQEEAEQEVRRLKSHLQTAEAQGNEEVANQIRADITVAQEKVTSWGTGGSAKRAIDAITNAGLLALNGGSSQSIATAAVSPYVNQLIKEATKDYPALNIPTHILWGAVEAELMGGSAQTGAISTVAGELGAKYLTEHLYDKESKDLTETERVQIKEMAKALAGGLAAAGQGARAVKILSEFSVGMAVANNAVENNFLSTLSQDRREALEKKIKEGKASQKEIMEFISYEQDDHTSDYLADKARNHPEEMTDDEWSRLGNSIQRYVSESLRNRETPDEINRSVKEIVSGNYIKGYGYAYALDDKYRSDLPSRWSWTGVDKSEKEERYSDLKYKYITRPKCNK